MDCYLIITKGGNRRVPLNEKQQWMIGRGRGNDIVLEDTLISRRHAMLQVTPTGEVYLVDFGSRNGSFLNGYRVGARVKLSNGDQLRFGDAAAEFSCIAGDRSGAPEARTIAGTMPMQIRRMLSVLVVDIRDFTSLSRDIGEERLAELMGALFRRCGEIIREHSSRMEKYIGDAIMAVWFHDEPGGSDDYALRPLQALGAIYQTTFQLSKRFALAAPLRIGAGVNSGYAMVGNTGSTGCPDYTALGDTVNAAFRLESATKNLQCDVAIGQCTYERLRKVAGRVPFHRTEAHLKGLGHTTVYRCSFSELQKFLAGDVFAQAMKH